MPCACTSRRFARPGRKILCRTKAVAHELAARFYDARGFETPADAYPRRARQCYLRWRAQGKVRQLDRLYPHLAGPEGRIQRPPTTSWSSSSMSRA